MRWDFFVKNERLYVEKTFYRKLKRFRLYGSGRKAERQASRHEVKKSAEGFFR